MKGLDVGWMSARRPIEFHHVATTGHRGRFEVNLLPPGPCRMVAGRFLSFFRTPAHSDDHPSTPVFRLEQDATIDAPDLRLPVDPRILGTLKVVVVDASGKPVKGADVHCSTLVSPWGDRSGERKTDSKGRIRFQGVNPGEATVSTSAASPLGNSHRAIWLPPGSIQQVRVVLPRAPRRPGARRKIRVVCRDDTGRPLRGCRTYVFGFDTKSTTVEAKTGRGGVAVLQGHLRDEYRGTLSGSAWKPGYERAQLQIDVQRGQQSTRVEAILRRTVNVIFKVVDASTGAVVQRTSFDFTPEGGHRHSTGMSLGIVGPDPVGIPRLLFLPSEQLPIGKATVVIASPGYVPQVLPLRVRTRKGNRVVRVRLRPAR